MLWLAAVIAGITWEVRGSHHIPAGPALFAFKHQSAWETLAVPVLLPAPAMVIKRELFWVPFYGWFAKRAGMIGIDRSAGSRALRRMLQAARRAKADGRPVVIFPQGTRTVPRIRGGAAKPYQPGVAALYGELDLPAVPVALNSGLFWGRRAFRKEPGRIIVEYLPPIAPGLAKREFLRRLEGAIEQASARLEAESVAADR
jgi:1-acyl-sn-glycerol-3-phosphate acyltransferase